MTLKLFSNKTKLKIPTSKRILLVTLL